MANHKSAKKRSKQSLKRNKVNKILMTNIKKNITKFLHLLNSKQTENLQDLLSQINSSLSKATKKGVIKKEFASRKLSSLSKKIN